MCKIDHTEAATIPQFLCRTCNPHLIPSAAVRKAADLADQAKRLAEDMARKHARDVDTVRGKIAAFERRGEPEAGSVPAKILAGLRRKLEKLEHGKAN